MGVLVLLVRLDGCGWHFISFQSFCLDLMVCWRLGGMCTWHGISYFFFHFYIYS